MKPHKSLWSFISAPAPRYMLRLKALHGVFDNYLTRTPFSFIEIGPGMGDISAYLLSFANASSGAAIDFSEQSVHLLKKRFSAHSNFTVYHSNVADFKSDHSFDVLLAFEVLEHIEDDTRFLQQTRKLLTDQGLLMLSVPAYQKLWQKQDVYAGHIRRYERQELQEKISNAGYEVIEIFDYGFPLMRMLKPIKELYYKAPTTENKEQLTKNSGVDRPLYRGKSVYLNLFLLYPFMVLQNWFRKAGLGDGLVVVARKK